MSFSRCVASTMWLVLVAGCSGGGGGGSSVPVGPPWPKFRHDASNTGQSGAFVASNRAEMRSVDLHGAIVGSPAIAFSGTVYIGTTRCDGDACDGNGGALAAVTNVPFALKWMTQVNPKCAAPDQSLGSLISSPALYDLGLDTNIFIASDRGLVHAFRDNATATAPEAVFCFDPRRLAGSARVDAASFRSSPTFTTSAVSGAIDGVFLGAEVTEVDGQTTGRVYAITNDGSLRWEFPRPGSARIAPITSSLASGFGTLYALSDTGILYALTLDGNLKWSFDTGSARATDSLFALSPSTSTTGVFLNTADGSLLAINPNGTLRWRREVQAPFAGSLALSGVPVSPLPSLTPTPLLSPTPESTATGAATATPTPTLTPVPLVSSLALFGVTRQGQIVVYEAMAPTPHAPSSQTEIEAQVLGSPALTGDGLIVFAGTNDSGGVVYVLDLATGQPPATPTGTPAPVAWPKEVDGAGFESSPAIADDGTIWIGSRDGRLYAFGSFE